MIQRKEKVDFVGTMFSDEWSEHIRVNFSDESKERQYSQGQFEKLLNRKDWEVTVKPTGNSGSVREIIERKAIRTCGDCGNTNPFYDTDSDEWYCPKCSR